MASGGVGKVLAALVGLVFVGGGVWAFKASQRTGLEVEAAHEARLELPIFASGMARCAAGKGVPETTKRLPARLADVSGKAHVIGASEVEDAAFPCGSLKVKGEQRLQYRWRKLTERSGRVEARADVDADGKPDHWFEIDVSCERVGECLAANYITEVMADGMREPPMMLTWLGRARRYRGDAPTLDEEETPPPAAPSAALSASVAASAPAPAPLAVVSGSSPTALDTLFIEAERRASAARAGAALLELTFQGVEGELLDPAAGGSMRGLYGVPDGKGLVHAADDVVLVTFGKAGLEVKPQKLGRELRAVGAAACAPERLRSTFPGVGSWTATLSWDAARGRALWAVRRAKQAPRWYSAEGCVAVR